MANVSYLQKGNGKDLLFLHGYMSSKEAFSSQISYFSNYYRVTALDFLGFGQSGKLTEPFSVGDYAVWTKKVLRELGVQNPHVIAHSFGCRVALKMAEGRGQVFDKILLTGPAGVILKRGMSYKIKVKSYRIVKKFFPNFAERKFGSEEYRALSPLMRESYKKIVNEDLRDCASRVTNETLIVEGNTDTVTPKRAAEVYLSALPNGKIRFIDGGHFAFVENPLTFNLLAEEFFSYG